MLTKPVLCSAFTRTNRAASNKRCRGQTFQSGPVQCSVAFSSRQRLFLRFLVGATLEFRPPLSRPSPLPCPGSLCSTDHALQSPTACGNTDHFIISDLPLQEAAFILSNTQKITVKGSHFMENLKLRLARNCLFVSGSLGIVSFVDFDTQQRFGSGFP